MSKKSKSKGVEFAEPEVADLPNVVEEANPPVLPEKAEETVFVGTVLESLPKIEGLDDVWKVAPGKSVTSKKGVLDGGKVVTMDILGCDDKGFENLKALGVLVNELT